MGFETFKERGKELRGKKRKFDWTVRTAVNKKAGGKRDREGKRGVEGGTP